MWIALKLKFPEKGWRWKETLSWSYQAQFMLVLWNYLQAQLERMLKLLWPSWFECSICNPVSGRKSFSVSIGSVSLLCFKGHKETLYGLSLFTRIQKQAPVWVPNPSSTSNTIRRWNVIPAVVIEAYITWVCAILSSLPLFFAAICEGLNAFFFLVLFCEN